jgi:hypothetical protein
MLDDLSFESLSYLLTKLELLRLSKEKFLPKDSV